MIAAALLQAPFAEEIAAFERADAAAPLDQGGIVFVGSSTFRMWESLADDMAPLPVLNRGFGGSRTPDANLYFDKLVTPHRPSVVVFYEGDNDLADEGTKAETVLAEFKKFDERLARELPATELVFVSIKPSASRWARWSEVRKANDLIRTRLASEPRRHFADIGPAVLENGKPNPSLYRDDELHLNADGYEHIAKIVRPVVEKAWRAATKFAVQPVYLVPEDQPSHPEYEAAIRKSVIEVRDWYKSVSGVEFRLLPLRKVVGPDYLTLRGGEHPTDEVRADKTKTPAWWEEIDQAIGGLQDDRVLLVFAQGGGGFAAANLVGHYQGKCVVGDWVLEPLSGVREPAAVTADTATWQVEGGTPMGTIVHELGHAFGLHHPERYAAVKSIMKAHWDYPNTGLTPWEIGFVKQSPFFAQTPPADPPIWLDFENQDVMIGGQEVVLQGRFDRIDRVEIVSYDPDASSSRKPTLTKLEGQSAGENRVRVMIPKGLGPGWIRLRKGTDMSNSVPVNFYDSAKED